MNLVEGIIVQAILKDLRRCHNGEWECSKGQLLYLARYMAYRKIMSVKELKSTLDLPADAYLFRVVAEIHKTGPL